MRVLHLIEQAGAQGAATTLAMIADAAGRLGDVQQHVVLLGGSAWRSTARATGLHDAVWCPTPYGHGMLAWPSLRRRMQRGEIPSQFDVVHCWGAGSFTLAALQFRDVPRIMTVTAPAGRHLTHWLRTISENARAAPVALLPISSTIRRGLISGGVPEAAVHVLRPAIDMARLPMAQRRALRDQWLEAPEELPDGADPAPSPDAPVIALLSDPPHAADAMAAMLAVGLAGETLAGGKAQLRLLVHPHQFRRAKAQRMMRMVARPYTLIPEPRVALPWEILPGCDAALAMGPAGGGLSLLWAMAGNVPIVGEATYAVAELVEDRHSALLSRPDQPRSLAHNLSNLLNDPQLAWKLKDSARHEAYSYFSRQRYCQSLLTVYRQLIERKPVEVPLMQSTGGLRFTGRG